MVSDENVAEDEPDDVGMVMEEPVALTINILPWVLGDYQEWHRKYNASTLKFGHQDSLADYLGQVLKNALDKMHDL
jgi:hypothetical protein